MVPHAAKNSHCSFCGAFFLDQKDLTKKCNICNNITYFNPSPVSASLIRVLTPNDKIGILVIQRAIYPKLGEWALPGGFLMINESWEEGTVRELQEEVRIKIDPQDIEAYHIVSVINNLLIFNSCKKIINWNEINFTPNDEVRNIDVCFLPTELAFPTHTECLKKYLNEICVI